ncbi:MAG: hypothetical protein ACRENE_33480 [Polyangiaceae bacterium]
MSDLTKEEQAHVRRALQVLRYRCGGWKAVGKAVKVSEYNVRNIGKTRGVSAGVAIRVARFLKINIDDLLAGKFVPPGTCPNCGHSIREP